MRAAISPYSFDQEHLIMFLCCHEVDFGAAIGAKWFTHQRIWDQLLAQIQLA